MAIINSAIEIGCNVTVTLRTNLHDRAAPVILMSSGFGYSSFAKPMPLAVIRAAEYYGFNWLQYVYAERNRENASQDLILSSAIHTLRTLMGHLQTQGFDRYAFYGNSFGANISLDLALLEAPDFIILSSPVVDFERYRRLQLGGDAMRRWEEDGRISMQYGDANLESSVRFLHEARRQMLLQRCSALRCPALVVFGGGDRIVSDHDVPTLIARLQHAKSLRLPASGHTICEPDSIRMVDDALTTFFATQELH